MSCSNPPCKNCGAITLRWAWYEADDEPVQYFYCLFCDRAGREPCIQVHPNQPVEDNAPPYSGRSPKS